MLNRFMKPSKLREHVRSMSTRPESSIAIDHTLAEFEERKQLEMLFPCPMKFQYCQRLAKSIQPEMLPPSAHELLSALRDVLPGEF